MHLTAERSLPANNYIVDRFHLPLYCGDILLGNIMKVENICQPAWRPKAPKRQPAKMYTLNMHVHVKHASPLIWKVFHNTRSNDQGDIRSRYIMARLSVMMVLEPISLFRTMLPNPTFDHINMEWFTTN